MFYQMNEEHGLSAKDVHVGDIVYYWDTNHTDHDFIGMKAKVLDVDVDRDKLQVRNERFVEWMYANRFKPFEESAEISAMYSEFC